MSGYFSGKSSCKKYLKNFLKDQNGSALVTVLSLIVILTILAMALMGIVTVQSRFIRRDHHRTQARYLAEAGIQKALWYLSGHGGRNIRWRTVDSRIQLFDQDHALVTVSQWGGYLEITSRAKYKNQTARVTSLVGEKMPDVFNNAVVIGGTDFPLVVCGSNEIIGDVVTGPGGVREGEIKGDKFSGEKAVNGQIRINHSPQMPYFDASFIEASMQEFENMVHNPAGRIYSSNQVFSNENPLDFSRNQRIYVQGDAYLKDSLMSEFKSNRKRQLVAGGNIYLESGLNIKCKIELIAGNHLIIRGDVRLEDAIIYAQNGIDATTNLTGTVQIFSPGDIQIGGNSYLNYPSVIYSSGRIGEDRIEGKIAIRGQAVVEGTIILQHHENVRTSSMVNNCVIEIGKSAHVSGIIYSSNNTTLDGTVNGAVITGKFFFYESPTNYVNWMRNAMIDRTQPDRHFLLPLSFNGEFLLTVYYKLRKDTSE